MGINNGILYCLSMISTPKKERKPATERRKILIDITIQCIQAGGIEGASIRKISDKAGISVGLINHHFVSKDHLIAEAYRCVAEEILGRASQQATLGGDEPRAQLSGFFHGSFLKSDPGYLKIWIAFWSMTEQSPQVQSVHDKTNQDFRATLENLLKNLCDDLNEISFDVRLGAIGLSALIDGLWLELCLNPKTFSPEESVQLCEAWVDGLVSGVYQLPAR